MTPSEEHLAFYHELGFAIAQWGMVEASLWWVVTTCFDPGSRKATALGFYSIENFRSKLAFADKVFSAAHTEEVRLKQWAKLYARLHTHSQTRNKLVHRPVVVYPASPPGRRYALIQSIQPPAKKKRSANSTLPPDGALCIRDIAKIRREFSAVDVSLQNFYYRLNGQPEPFPERTELDIRPPTIPQIRAQIRALLPSSPEPCREGMKRAHKKSRPHPTPPVARKAGR